MKHDRAQFEDRREEAVARFVAATANLGEIECRVCSVSGAVNWRFEQTDCEFRHHPTGNCEQLCDAMRHYINQGHYLSWAVGIYEGQSAVWLKVWEFGEREPEWPSGFVASSQFRHQPTSASGE